ncbi:hypothetical protein GQ600_26353 [Phytophthora cactorum]|nr:hypothetical protein GQ600_26353 [Phytophthora cactorum]
MAQKQPDVIDAALLVALLIERALSNHESLLMVSKDCRKCFDRISRWCMDLIYRGLGVPDVPRRLMMNLLQHGVADVRQHWCSHLSRVCIGQGPILSILHIACYMNCLQNNSRNVQTRCLSSITRKATKSALAAHCLLTIGCDNFPARNPCQGCSNHFGYRKILKGVFRAQNLL